MAKPLGAPPQAHLEQTALQSEDLRRTERLRLTSERSCLLDRRCELRVQQERIAAAVVGREIVTVASGQVARVLREPRTFR